MNIIFQLLIMTSIFQSQVKNVPTCELVEELKRRHELTTFTILTSPEPEISIRFSKSGKLSVYDGRFVEQGTNLPK
jgi:hypothetical protein